MPDTFLRNTPNALNAPRNAPTTTAYYIMVDSFLVHLVHFFLYFDKKYAGVVVIKWEMEKRKIVKSAKTNALNAPNQPSKHTA